jgi:hypothetical protein
MPRAPWTYRLETPDATAAGLEGYAVREEGARTNAGTVSALIEHEGELLVVAELGSPPATSDLRAIPVERVEVDHDALAVVLPPGELGRALELDPDRAVRDGEAEANRVAVPPPELVPPPAPPDASGPTDTPVLHAAIALALLAAFTTLGVVALTYAADTPWLLLLLAVPAGLALASGLSAYRAYRHPYAASSRSRRVAE